MTCLAVSLWIYFTYYRIQKKTDDNYPEGKSFALLPSKLIRLTPSAGYSLSIIPLNLVYRKLATFMTDFGKTGQRLIRSSLHGFSRESSSWNQLWKQSDDEIIRFLLHELFHRSFLRGVLQRQLRQRDERKCDERRFTELTKMHSSYWSRSWCSMPFSWNSPNRSARTYLNVWRRINWLDEVLKKWKSAMRWNKPEHWHNSKWEGSILTTRSSSSDRFSREPIRIIWQSLNNTDTWRCSQRYIRSTVERFFSEDSLRLGLPLGDTLCSSE